MADLKTGRLDSKREPSDARSIRFASRAILPVIESLEKLGVSREDLQVALGPGAAELLEDPNARFAYPAVQAFWDSALAQSGDPEIGLHAALLISPGDYGVIGYLGQASRSVKDAAGTLLRFRRLLADSISFDFEDTTAGVLLVHRVAEGIRIPRAAADFVLATIAVQGRRALGVDLPLLEIYFSHSQPTRLDDYKKIFGVPVHFGAAHNAILFAHVNIPLPHPDEQLCAVLERHAEILLEQLPESRDLVDGVRHAIAVALPEKRADVERIARDVELSGRTLRRRLKDEGLSFRELVAQVRCELALRYLDEGRQSVSEIAFLLGFSEPSAFHRAFRRWTGHIPAEHRRAHPRA
ncbi:MAG: AraC family transcriptional regulator [Deltaproteobacteria bacterium]|nr:AraC family transcriptional regulator [Deltaproteobacteria bacterium]